MLLEKGSTTNIVTEDDARELIIQACDQLQIDGKRVLVITRMGHAPHPFRSSFAY